MNTKICFVLSCLVFFSASTFAEEYQKKTETETKKAQVDSSGAVTEQHQSDTHKQSVGTEQTPDGPKVSAKTETAQGSHAKTQNPDGSVTEHGKKNASSAKASANADGSVELEKQQTENEKTKME